MARKIVVIDCETDPFLKGRVPKPFIWELFDGEEAFLFEDAKELIDFLRDKEWIAYAHNGGKFDWHYFFPYLEAFDEEILLIHGRLAKFKIGACEFRDSYSILPIPLSSYQKTEIDYAIFEKKERNKPKNKRKILNYLHDDCVYLYELVDRFIKKYGLSLTMAGASLKQWEKIAGRKAPKSNAAYYEQLSKYYYGGRVQCFDSGIMEKRLEVADINSAYPYAMLSKHPIGTNFLKAKGTPNKLRADMFLSVECIAKGCFPFRDEDGRLIFPTDKIKRLYHVTGHELIAALETKSLEQVKIIEYVRFFELISFSDYINKFYDERKEAKERAEQAKEFSKEWRDAKADDLFCKLFMNSLYGKFGSNPNGYKKNIILPPEYIRAIGNPEFEFNLGGFIGDWILGERDLEEKEKHFYNVATSASITGYVRAYLWKALYASVNPVYCDTDCIIAETVCNVTYGKDLGQWELEGIAHKAGIAGKKLYVLEGDFKGKKYKTASKGAKLTPQEIYKLASGGIIKYEPDNPVFSIKSPMVLNKLTGELEGPKFIDKILTGTTEKFLDTQKEAVKMKREINRKKEGKK